MGSGLWGRLRRVEGFIRLVAGGWGGRSCLGRGGAPCGGEGGGDGGDFGGWRLVWCCQETSTCQDWFSIR